MQPDRSYRTALSVLTFLFFFWGFVASANDILIPLFKSELQLEQWQSQWISFVFYVSYTTGTLLYLLISKIIGKDWLQSMGYRSGMVLGLLIASSGTCFFIPASALKSFFWMLAGLYVMGLGFSLMQTVANALIICLGEPSGSSQRLSLAGGINNIGSTLGPLVLGSIVFSGSEGYSGNISRMYIPYTVMGLLFVLMAIWFWFSSVPQHLKSDQKTEDSPVTMNGKIIGSMLAIFFYVGVEVSTVANMPEFLRKEYAFSASDISVWVSLYWAALMMGRWVDSAAVSGKHPGSLWKIKIIFALSAFLFFCLVSILGGKNIHYQFYFVFCIPLFLLIDRIAEGRPERQLQWFSMMGICCIIFAITVKHWISVYALVLSGMFCSTLWPAIFSLALKNEELRASAVSARLIMMVMGGGIISMLQGYLVSFDSIGIRGSYWINGFCFLYLWWYGLKFSKTLPQSAG